MSLREKQGKFARMVGLLLLYANDTLLMPIVVIEWYRDIERQKYLVSIGRSKTLKSKHIDGLAIDICFLGDIKDDGILNFAPDTYKALGEYWESLGGRWGGRFGDNPTTQKIEGWDAMHFEAVDNDKK